MASFTNAIMRGHKICDLATVIMTNVIERSRITIKNQSLLEKEIRAVEDYLAALFEGKNCLHAEEKRNPSVNYQGSL